MSKQFHDEEFGSSTLLKLDIFRRYVREWIPVFLTTYKEKHNFQRVCLFDFFSGPGMDAAGNLGTPTIIYDELKKYCSTHSNKKSKSVAVDLFFNDIESDKVETLKQHLASIECSQRCCTVHTLCSPFDNLLGLDTIKQPLQSPNTACLVIIDQFGIKHVDRDVFRFFAACPRTDIMFFLSSSFVRRFADDASFNTRLPITPEKIKQTSHKQIHRELCECYKSLIPSTTPYHLSQFSFEKVGNIYGIIFGSGSLLGLEKFLKVAWIMDKDTGEANYDIDDDPIRKSRGQKFLIDDMNGYKKLNAFEDELKKLLISKPTDNLYLYQFCLERGFLPKQMSELLRKWQDEKILQVYDPATGATPRKGTFYIAWEYFKKNEQKLLFHIKE